MNYLIEHLPDLLGTVRTPEHLKTWAGVHVSDICWLVLLILRTRILVVYLNMDISI